MLVTNSMINAAVENATIATKNLTYTKDGKHFSKVCCVCDRLIRHGKEDAVKLSDLDKFGENFSKSKIGNHVPASCKDHYTVQCYDTNMRKYKFLKGMVLSRRSHATKVGRNDALGCCAECSGAVKAMKVNISKLPKYAICNGLLMGKAPSCITELNEVELALISVARINKHIFSFTAGTHKSIKGWHSMYYNDLEHLNGVANYIATNTISDGGPDFEEDSDDQVEDFEDEILRESVDMETASDDEESDNESPPVAPMNGKKMPVVAVVLCGPFTPSQKVLTRERTKVRWWKLRLAMRWLKKNNKLYADFKLPEKAAIEPIFVDHSENIESSNENVESSFEISAVFPDSNEPTRANGGLDSQATLKENTLEALSDPSNNVEATLIARPTSKIMQDYKGDNLVRAFPLQFPYGIGACDADGEERHGINYYQFLSSLSNPDNHRPDFVLVLHNMFERQRMVKNTFLRCDDGMAQDFTDIKDDDMQDAVLRLLDGSRGSHPADVFLSKMKAVTSSMGHTNEAAKKARQKMFAMISSAGLPAMMFTITPEDGFNFRIRIHASSCSGEENPPSQTNTDEEVLADFAVQCGSIRQTYPGLCAFDFEQVIAITVEHLLGWSINKQSNKEDEGLFGDLQCWSYAVEEQGRKTLHAHFLLWLLKWSDLLQRLYNASTRQEAAAQLQDYIDKVLTTALHGFADSAPRACPPTCSGTQDPTPCTLQDLRNLRCKDGESSLGGKAILLCGECKTTFDSESLIERKLEAMGLSDSNERSARLLRTLGIADSRDKKRLRMEILLMNHLLPNSPDHSSSTADAKFIIGALRNLHRSRHCVSCFKKDYECRMHCPSRECLETVVKFEENYARWFDWTGISKPRQLFYSEPKRSHADAFVNIHNEHATNLFGCNTNVICGCDGGSVMYCTCYQSKGTQKEDNEHFAIAARKMISKMNQAQNDENNEIEQDESQRIRTGLRGLIGSVLLTTSAHIVSAPLASYLIRNESRFGYSNEFAYIFTDGFFKDELNELSLSAVDGQVFMTSFVANYRFRPQALEDTNLYDFVCNYIVARRSNESLAWVGESHPSRDHLAVKKRKTAVVPIINWMDFVNTAKFEGRNILTEQVPHNSQAASHQAMEEYARKVSAIFIPFRSLNDLKNGDGKFLPGLQTAFQNGAIGTAKQSILQNIQDCRNSLDAGRMKDPLERLTTNPPKTNAGNRQVTEDEDGAGFEEIMADLTRFVQADTENDINFRDSGNRLSFKSDMIRDNGMHRCGYNFVRSPDLTTDAPSVVTSGGSRSTETSSTRSATARTNSSPWEDDENFVTHAALHEISFTVRERVTGNSSAGLPATGTLANIDAWAEHLCKNDDEQKTAFRNIASNFVLQLHREAEENDKQNNQSRQKRQKLNNIRKDLESVNPKVGKQLICFLTGAGGSGKSNIIKGIIEYGKQLCKNLGVEFTKRTIVVTALTGAAAVTIGGETTHGACCLNKTKNLDEEQQQWTRAYLLIIDEVSFASRETLEKLNNQLRELMNSPTRPYGGISILFAGDFSQLPPVQKKPLFVYKDFQPWYEWVNCFLELTSNHRFSEDPEWGEILQRCRSEGLNQQDASLINARVIGSAVGPKESEIPDDVTYAVKTNLDRNAINDAIFMQHLQKTHSRIDSAPMPQHTIVVKASRLKWKKKGTRREYVDFSAIAKDLLYAGCSDAHLTQNKSRHIDPFLKLYYGRPIMINQNLDVDRCEANGAYCTFVGMQLKPGVTINDLETVQIDGFFLRCAAVTQIQHLVLKNEDAPKDANGNCRLVLLQPRQETCSVKYPIPLFGPPTKHTPRLSQGMSLLQFPIIISNAVTVHKLQGRTIKNLLVSCCNYADNWMYVVLSRVKTRGGLFLRKPIDGNKLRGMSAMLLEFLDHFRTTKSPQKANEDEYRRQYT